ncbi:ComEC/Rec2 family competence protein [Bifidobacterium aquikefiricola]|uniref:ComEC/Rec2 family competence protein n=1 Tax=Bifidobacterium aquikefiricola TaxID=3059038 RepID=A0AB39U5A1_9BIFI
MSVQCQADPQIGIVDDQSNGNNDLRMLPIAVAIWLTDLLLPLMIEQNVIKQASIRISVFAREYRIGSPSLALSRPDFIGVLIGVLAVALIVIPVMLKTWHYRLYARILRLMPSFMALMAAIAIASIACLLSTMMTQTSNPLRDRATAMHTSETTTETKTAERTQAKSGSMTITAVIRLEEPWQRSARLGYTAMTQGKLRAIAYDHVVTQTSATVQLFISGDSVKLERGGTYTVFGTLEQSPWGSEALWLSAETQPIQLERPPLLWRTVNAMHGSFAKVVRGLSDQGRLLVTGLTLGTLTEMQLNDDESQISPELDERFVQRSKQQFRSAGIIHLMAVSGGHFALVATLCHWIRAAFRLPRLAIAIMHSVFSGILCVLVFPSDSVLRAAATTASLVSLAMVVGRKGQTVQQLSVIVSLVLIARPALAASYGFALSCAAVLGIGLWASRMTAILRRIMPIAVAQGISFTVSAQAFTLPIQILLQPEITVLSIPANLVVAPFVGFATVCGLLAVVVSWCVPQLGWLLVWLASCATSIIDRWAAICAEPEWAKLPWAQGIPGAVLAACFEVAIVAGCWGIARVREKIQERRTRIEAEFSGYQGKQFEKSKLDAIRLWWGTTTELLDITDSPEYRISHPRRTLSMYIRKCFRAEHHVQR